MEQQKNNKVFLTILVVIGLLGIYYLIAGLTGIWGSYALLHNGYKVQGNIVEVRRGTPLRIAGFFKGHSVTANYHTPGGQTLTVNGYINILVNPVVGNNITVLYNSAQPSLSEIYDPVTLWGGNVLAVMVGFAFLMGIYNYRKRSRVNPSAQLAFEQSQFQKFQQRTVNVNPNSTYGALNPHATRNIILTALLCFGGLVLLLFLISALNGH